MGEFLDLRGKQRKKETGSKVKLPFSDVDSKYAEVTLRQRAQSCFFHAYIDVQVGVLGIGSSCATREMSSTPFSGISNLLSHLQVLRPLQPRAHTP